MKFLQLPEEPPWKAEMPPAAAVAGILFPLVLLQIPIPGLEQRGIGMRIFLPSALALLSVAACVFVPLKKRFFDGVGIASLGGQFRFTTVMFFLALLGPSLIKYGTSFLLTRLGIPFSEEQEILTALRNSRGVDFGLFAAGIVLPVPCCEEVMFRRLLFGLLARKGFMWGALILQAVIFGILHFSLIVFLPLCFFGALQEFAYLKSRNLAVPILIHMLFNGLTVAGVFLDNAAC